MSIGPVELLVVKFPGNQFNGEIVPALEELVDNGTVRIIDFVFVIKDEAGNVEVHEYSDLAEEVAEFLSAVTDDGPGLLSEEDAIDLAQELEPNSSAALMVFENVWATRFQDAVVSAHGELVMSERIPRSVINALMEASQEFAAE